MTEHVLILLLAGPQHHDLYIVLTKLIHHISDQVEALLVCQAGYDSDHHRLVILVQSQLRLQGTFVLHFLLTEVHRIVIKLDIRIYFRTEIRVIHPVDDTAQIRRPRTHEAV